MKRGDSTSLSPEKDQVLFETSIPELDQNTSVKSDVSWFQVLKATNYLYIGIGFIVLLAAGIGLYLGFGKKIKDYFVVKRLRKEYLKFSDEFSQLMGQVMKDGDAKATEQALLKWKGYLGKLENKPYLSLTTKELVQNGIAESMQAPLKAIDRCIYGKVEEQTLRKSMEELEDYSLSCYKAKLEEVKQA